MSANFTSGWLGNNEAAWHGEGVVTEGTLPAREAFEVANALFTVEKRELVFSKYYSDAVIQERAGVYATVRTDTQDKLGVVTDRYEIVQNDALLRMAEFIREETDMDSVVVLENGAKVCFTATLKGASADIVPGDTINRRIVGYLGHDGKTGCGAIFTDVRVVCSNTFAAAHQSRNKLSITHTGTANQNFDKLIQSIDASRQTFTEQCELMREFTRLQFDTSDFNQYVSEVYDVDEHDLFNGKFRKMPKLRRAYVNGLGARDFAPFTLWSAVNAITEVETSTKTGTIKQQRAKFKSANFGQGLEISRKAMSVAKQLVAA